MQNQLEIVISPERDNSTLDWEELSVIIERCKLACGLWDVVKDLLAKGKKAINGGKE